MKRRIIGIDVGKNGGIVVYDTENNKLLECIKMPPTPKDLLDFLSIYLSLIHISEPTRPY